MTWGKEESMMQKHFDNYGVLDQPRVLRRLFHPRFENGYRPHQENRRDFMIPVEEGVGISASLHFLSSDAPMLLFFHGNGEIVSDYDDIAGLFNQAGLNFFVVDYRGYGRSGGTPTVSAMLRDCHRVFEFLAGYMKENDYSGPLCVMGRSLGSASAVELGATRPDQMQCLIIESGFARISPLLKKLGVDPDVIGFSEEQGSENIGKIKNCRIPCLIIHAENDQIIPISEGEALLKACGSARKIFLEIKEAGHNDIFFAGMTAYLDHVKTICRV